VVDRWASDGESGSHRIFLFQYDVWTMFYRQILEKTTSTILMAWYFITKSSGIGYIPVLEEHALEVSL
jgi:hypothetical protein